MNELILLAVAAFLSGILLTIKSYYTKDLGALGTSFSRIFLGLMALLVLYNLATMMALYWAVMATLLGDIANVILFSFTYEKQVENKLKRELKEVTFKLLSILDHSVTSMFTISLSGEIEYVNQSFCSLFSTPRESLIGRNLFAMFNVEKEEFLNNLEIEICHRNKQYTLKGYRTKNGHDTITGSVYGG
jgi:PAS domain S-box-containing protein